MLTSENFNQISDQTNNNHPRCVVQNCHPGLWPLPNHQSPETKKSSEESAVFLFITTIIIFEYMSHWQYIQRHFGSESYLICIQNQYNSSNESQVPLAIVAQHF